MIHLMNTDLNLDVFFAVDCPHAIKDSFLQLVEKLPVPRLAEIQSFNHSFDCRQPKSGHVFPFFRRVSSTVDLVIEEVVQELKEQEDEIAQCTKQSTGSKERVGKVKETVIERLNQKVNS